MERKYGSFIIALASGNRRAMMQVEKRNRGNHAEKPKLERKFSSQRKAPAFIPSVMSSLCPQQEKVRVTPDRWRAQRDEWAEGWEGYVPASFSQCCVSSPLFSAASRPHPSSLMSIPPSIHPRHLPVPSPSFVSKSNIQASILYSAWEDENLP